MSEVVRQRWPDGLAAEVDAVAGAGKRTEFTVRAVRAALGGGPPLMARTEADARGADRLARRVETTPGGSKIARSGRDLMSDLRAETGLTDDEALARFQRNEKDRLRRGGP